MPTITMEGSELAYPELEEEARLVLVSGPMRSGKTTVAIEYTRKLALVREVTAFRPEQDTRSASHAVESQNPMTNALPAERVRDLGALALLDDAQHRAFLLDEPFFWANADFSPDMNSFRGVQRALDVGGVVVVSTLDKTYMEEEFEWFALLREEGRSRHSRGQTVFQHVEMRGFCELCDVKEPALANPSVSTNLYRNGIKVSRGDQNIADDDESQQIYVPCCDECRDTRLTLPEDFSHRFEIQTGV